MDYYQANMAALYQEGCTAGLQHTFSITVTTDITLTRVQTFPLI